MAGAATGYRAPRSRRSGSKTSAVGVSGTKTRVGLPFDEFLIELQGYRGIRKYREMMENDAIIGAVLYALEMLLRGVTWKIEPADNTPEAMRWSEWAEQVLFRDMEHTWDEFVANSLSFLPYGFSVSEIVLNRRTDGLLGVGRLAHRPQTTLDYWLWDDAGRAEWFVQCDPNTYHTYEIPLERMVHFRTSSYTNSPQGKSILRNAYRSYYFAKHVEQIEAIAVERELNGLPVIKLPSDILSATSGDKVTIRDEYKKIARDIKRGDQDSVLLPSDTYVDADGNPTDIPMVDFKLMASEGTRDIDTDKVIKRHQQNMARSVVADFVMLGQGDKGSFALSHDKTDLFLSALAGHAENMAQTLDRQLLTYLWRANGLPDELRPTMHVGRIGPVDLKELGQYVSDLAGAGIQVFGDEDIENALLENASLPTEHRSDPDIMGRAEEQIPLDLDDGES